MLAFDVPGEMFFESCSVIAHQALIRPLSGVGEHVSFQPKLGFGTSKNFIANETPRGHGVSTVPQDLVG